MLCPNQKNCPAGSIPYIVREGDTLYNIAKTYNTTVLKIMELNVNLNPYNLNIGQTICIPQSEETYPQCQSTNYYIAQEGDTFFSIGRKFGVDTEEIINANVGVRPENIYTGIILCIPVAPSPVCLRVNSNGEDLCVIDKKTGKETFFKSRLDAKALLVPGTIVLTKKRLQSGATEGPKELLFSPSEVSIRGEGKMSTSSAVFIETDDKSMLEIFNACPIGTTLEVVR